MELQDIEREAFLRRTTPHFSQPTANSIKPTAPESGQELVLVRPKGYAFELYWGDAITKEMEKDITYLRAQVPSDMLVRFREARKVVDDVTSYLTEALYG